VWGVFNFFLMCFSAVMLGKKNPLPDGVNTDTVRGSTIPDRNGDNIHSIWYHVEPIV
jgi:hypothetical protein